MAGGVVGGLREVCAQAAEERGPSTRALCPRAAGSRSRGKQFERSENKGGVEGCRCRSEGILETSAVLSDSSQTGSPRGAGEQAGAAPVEHSEHPYRLV